MKSPSKDGRHAIDALDTTGFDLHTVDRLCFAHRWRQFQVEEQEERWFLVLVEKEGIPNTTEHAVIWTEDVLMVTGKPPTRGFGGRIYFYNEKSQAIPVEGELVVYGYEEAAAKSVDVAGSAADKRFDSLLNNSRSTFLKANWEHPIVSGFLGMQPADSRRRSL